MEKNNILEALRLAIINGEKEEAEYLSNQAIKENIDPLIAISESVRKGLDVVGDAFRKGEFFLPELVMAGEAATASTAILEKALTTIGSGKNTAGLIVIGTVYGDVHDIGKTLVSTLFKAAGFSVIDLGINIPAEKFIEAVKEHKPDILGLSSLLSTTVPEQEVIIRALKKAGLRSTVKVLVGGGAVTQDWADHIGADAYGQDATEAVDKGRWLLGLA